MHATFSAVLPRSSTGSGSNYCLVRAKSMANLHRMRKFDTTDEPYALKTTKMTGWELLHPCENVLIIVPDNEMCQWFLRRETTFVARIWRRSHGFTILRSQPRAGRRM